MSFELQMGYDTTFATTVDLFLGIRAIAATISPRWVSLKLHTIAVFQSYPAKADNESTR